MPDPMEGLFPALSRMLQKGLKHLAALLLSPVVPPLSWPTPALFTQSDGNMKKKKMASENGGT